MTSERSLEIECRLDDVFRLIRTGRFSTPMLAEEVSIPTISRCVNALRLRGHDIRAEKHEDGWRYMVVGKKTSERKAKQASKLSDQK